MVDFGSLVQADGVFFTGSTIGFRDISDGTSQTAAFSERTLGSGQIAGASVERLILQRPAGFDPTPKDCAAQEGNWFAERGGKWIIGNYGNTLYNHYYQPNSTSWDCMNIQQQKALMTARSRHPGGVVVLYCDGAVRIVRSNILLQVWRAMATRAGGEPLGEW
jgi:prepilin-type processing-associated H-X9-DG protein